MNSYPIRAAAREAAVIYMWAWWVAASAAWLNVEEQDWWLTDTGFSVADDAT